MAFSQETLELNIQGVDSKLIIPEFNTPAQKWSKNFQARPDYQYEAVMVALLRKILEESADPVFADIGPFIGYYTIYAAKLLQMLDKGKVLAFESNPEYIQTLQENIELNAVEAEVFHTVLSDRENEPLNILGSSVSVDTDAEGDVLQSTTLDKVCKDHQLHPTVAKMDVHGFEGKILGGMSEVLQNDLQYLLMELHPNIFLEKFAPGITRMHILDMLEDAGFTNYYIAGHRYSWSDGMRRFYETGEFAYQALTRENRGLLLFDRHNHVFVLSSKTPLEALIGPSSIDPSVE